jgi:hypothetical protein
MTGFGLCCRAGCSAGFDPLPPLVSVRWLAPNQIARFASGFNAYVRAPV